MTCHAQSLPPDYIAARRIEALEIIGDPASTPTQRLTAWKFMAEHRLRAEQRYIEMLEGGAT